MKLWLIKQNGVIDYDTFDSAVVAAETEHQARQTHPSGHAPDGWPAKNERFPSWPLPEHVTATLIGEAEQGIAAGAVLSSFNAG